MRIDMSRRVLVSLSLIAGLALGALVVGASAQAQPTGDQPVVARVTITTRADLRRFMGLGLDVLEVREGDDLFVVTTPADVDRLRVDGWTIRIDADHSSMLQRQQQEQQQRRQRTPGSLPAELFMGGYRSVPEMRTFLDDMAAQYPDLVEVFVYGASWERLNGGAGAGHDLFGITLTNKQRPGPKPTLFLMAAIHARELSTSELALRFVEYLLGGYGTDADATWLLDEHVIVVVPVVNPDGRVLAEQGYLQRKNTDTAYGSCSIPNIGVDLNRNASFKWGTVNTPSQSACSETYPGPAPVSEPETAALLTLVRSLFPDQRGPIDTDPSAVTATGVFITLHSYGNLVMWPWGWTETPAPNAVDLAAFGRKLAAYNGYTPQQSIDLYPTSGTTDDWAYGELGIAAFTFEVGPSSGTCGGFFPAFSCLDGGTGGSFWPRNLPAFLYAARVARAPFQLVQGPTAEAATAALLADGRVEVAVLLDEQKNGAQPIVAAEYYVDTPPWNGGTAVAMTPADGSFGSTVEVATAQLGPLTARHLIFVRGQDSTGAWGAVRGVFTPDPSCPATLSPTGQAFTSNGGSATVTVTTPSGCAWAAGTVSSWITITGGVSGVGPGSVSYSVAANASASARAGEIVIAGQRLAVAEDRQGSPPDLRETHVSGPPAVAPGGSFSVTDTTENFGDTIAARSTTRFYLSASGAKDGGAKLLSGSRLVPPLDSGGTSVGMTTVTIPSATALGTYLLVACADDTQLVSESVETNNCVASVTAIDVARPDLIETAVSNPPSAIPPGGSFSVTDTVENRGGMDAGASTTRYYLSADQKKGSSDKRFGETRLVASLAARGASTGTVTVTVPSTTSLGTYYLLVCADDTTDVTESNESNNCLAAANQVQVARPDLIETAVSNPPASAARGSGFAVTDTVTNQGGWPATASTTRYYLSVDQKKGTGDQPLTGTRPVPSVSAAGTSTGTATVSIPTTTPLRTYYLLACADDTTLVAEASDANNCRASATRVTVGR